MGRKCYECYYHSVVRGTQEYIMRLGSERYKFTEPANLYVCQLDNELLSERRDTCNAFTVNPYYMEKLFR